MIIVYLKKRNGSLPGFEESKLSTDKNKWNKASKLLTRLLSSESDHFPAHTADFPPLVFTPLSLQHPAPITPDPQEVDTMDWK